MSKYDIVTINTQEIVKVIESSQQLLSIETDKTYPVDVDCMTNTVILGTDIYDGNYTVTPKDKDQSLPTKGKTMNNDVLILKVPRYDTRNTSNGTTVVIG